LPENVENTVETGCGKSTILFSNIARRHRSFALDDRAEEGSSVDFFEQCPLSRLDRVEFVFGPTQQTLPRFEQHEPYDVILIDGPHGYPFPELEYIFLYPHLKIGGILVLDDVAIPTIGRMADVLAEDEMFELIQVVGNNTALFRRTNAETFDPRGDGWWLQHYNRRRVSRARAIAMADRPPVDLISSQHLDDCLQGAGKAANTGAAWRDTDNELRERNRVLAASNDRAMGVLRTAIEAILASTSWCRTRILRGGGSEPTLAADATPEAAAMTLLALSRSGSWELTAPLRLLRRGITGLRRLIRRPSL
jgi:predicted O-methyltransferase YrrM